MHGRGTDQMILHARLSKLREDTKRVDDGLDDVQNKINRLLGVNSVYVVVEDHSYSGGQSRLNHHMPPELPIV